MEPRPNLFGLDRPALKEVVTSLGGPVWRVDQLHGWLYRRRARAVSEMTDLPKGLRATLAERFDLRWGEVVERGHSRDGTIKYLFRLDDGATIETVYIPEERRRTICISTQAGCPLRCAFCLTGIAGYKRNLKAWEILGQVATVVDEVERGESAAAPGGCGGASLAPPPNSGGSAAAPEASSRPWNVVVMGMGEPLLNYDNTVQALRVLMDPEGFGIPPRKLTLSTVGILPALEKLMAEPVRPNLAISLHAPNTRLRRELMPIEEKYDIERVIATAQRYPIPSGGTVTYEYVLLGGVNDTPAHARDLVRLLRGKRGKVNLIPLNAAPEIPFEAPSEAAVSTFAGILAEAEIPVSVRRSRGQDILAACGQLHLRRGTAVVPAPAGP